MSKLNRPISLLTASRMKSFRACPRQHFYRYELARVPHVEHAPAAAFGTAIHAALEAWWTAWRDWRGLDALEAARSALPRHDDPYTAALGEAIVAAYDYRWTPWAATVTVLGVEQEFTAPLVHPESGRPARTWRLAGKMDLVARLGDGRVAFVDHKVTSADAGAGSDYRRRLTIDPQVGMYFDGCAALGTPADLALWDVIQRPALRPRRAAAEVKLKKDGTPRAGQRTEDESPEEFRERAMEALAAKGEESALQHVELVRLDGERDAFRWTLWHTVREIEATRDAVEAAGGDARVVPQNADACARYGGVCPYLPVCEGAAQINDDHRYRRLPVMHAELTAGLQTAPQPGNE